MALNTTTNRITYAGDDVSTLFSFPYYFLADADLVVIITNDATGVDTTQVLNTDYTVSGAGNEAGGSVTMTTAPATGETLVIYRDPSITQELDLVENDSAPAESLEEAYDKLTMICQRLEEQTERTMKLSDGFVDTFDTQLPSDLATPEYYLKVNAAGDAFEMAAAIDNDVTVPVGTGFLVKNGATSTIVRDIEGESGVVDVTNGDGQSGNVSIAIASGGIDSDKLADGFNDLTVVSENDNYTVASGDDLILVNSASDDLTVSLPTAVGNEGRQITVKRTDETDHGGNLFTVNTTTDELFIVGDPLEDLQKVQVSSSGTLPAPLAAATDYWVIYLTDSTVRLATSRANAEADIAIDITTTGTGTHGLSIVETTLTIDADGSEEIEGKGSILLLDKNDAITVVSDNVGWVAKSFSLNTYKEVSIIANTSQDTDDTYTTATGSSLTLKSGKYLIGYQGPVGLKNTSGGTLSMQLNIVIYDSTNTNYLNSTLAFERFDEILNSDIVRSEIHRNTEVSISADNTYEVRFRGDGLVSSTGVVEVGGFITSGLTDPDSNFTFYAKRIGL